MTNKQIRQQAGAVYRKHPGLLLAVELIVAMSTVLILLLQRFVPNPWQEIGRIAVLIAFYPVRLGSFSLYYAIFQGKPVKLGNILRYYREQGLVEKALLLGALMTAINLLFQYIPKLAAPLESLHPAMSALLVLPQLALMILQLWVMFRTYLVPYCIYADPVAHPARHIRDSFRAMKGYVFDLFVLQLPVLGLIIIIAFFFIIIAYVLGPSISFLMILAIPVYPLMNLYTAGFAHRMKGIIKKTSSVSAHKKEED